MASSPLLDQVRAVARLRQLSLRTEESYVQTIRRFILFHGKRHPAAMGATEIAEFLSHLALERHVSASTQNQAFSAILFLYQDVLRIRLAQIDEVVRARAPRRHERARAGPYNAGACARSSSRRPSGGSPGC